MLYPYGCPRRRMFSAAAGLMLLWAPNPAHCQAFKTTQGKATFVSRATLETFKGTSSSLNGLVDLGKGTVDFYLDLNTLRTDIGLRDEHMRETYLETDKHPFAEFAGTIEGFNPAIQDTQAVTVKGDFTVHGVKKARSIKGRMALSGSTLYIDATWEVLLTDHSIEIPKVLFLKLADQQEVTITAVLRKSN